MDYWPLPTKHLQRIRASILTAWHKESLVSHSPRNFNRGDRLFFFALKALSAGLVLVLAAMLVLLSIEAWPAFEKFGFFGFVSTSIWDPVKLEFGALPVIYGTIVSSLLALVIATPVSVGIALFASELAPKGLASAVMFVTEMLAAIPSVVYGLWGILVLAPFCRDYLGPFFNTYLGFLPLFEGAPFGLGMLTAGIILAIMITPTISSVCREIFRIVPSYQREAALGLGATKWEMMRLAVIKSSRGGIIGAVTLGLGRAIGETMAVTMVIGNRAEISLSLFAPGQTMASVIANEYAEATAGAHLSALVAVGVTLFFLTLLVNILARRIVVRMQQKLG